MYHVPITHSCDKQIKMYQLFQYKFWLEDGRQEFRMECLLCGMAEDSAAVLPNDPRKASAREF